jgi:hypothetical protein
VRYIILTPTRKTHFEIFLKTNFNFKMILNEVIRDECGVKEDVVTKIEKNMLRWFGHIERMDERRLTKEVYEADVGGNAGRERSRQTLLDQIGEV